MGFQTLLAQASEDGGGGGWAVFFAVVVLICIVNAIREACAKPKEYDVRLGGTIKQR